MNAFIKSVALHIDRDTPYVEALLIFDEKNMSIKAKNNSLSSTILSSLKIFSNNARLNSKDNIIQLLIELSNP